MNVQASLRVATLLGSTAFLSLGFLPAMAQEPVVQGNVATTGCPAGQAYGNDQGCHTRVKFFETPATSQSEIDRILSANGWRLASPAEVTAAWEHLKLHTTTFFRMSDGNYAVPVQHDVGPALKRGVNLRSEAVAVFAKGFFYVDAKAPGAPAPTTVVQGAVTITQPPPAPAPVLIAQGDATITQLPPSPPPAANAAPPVAPPPAPAEPGRTTIYLSTPPGETYVPRDTDPIGYSDEAADRCADPGNFMLDGWNGPSRPVLEEAARGLLPQMGWPATPTAIGRLARLVQRDPVMRWEFAPHMIEATWKAIVAKSPSAAQAAFKKRFSTWAGCDKNLIARLNTIGWNQAMGKNIRVSVNGVSILWLKHNPSYKPVTLGVLTDTGPSIASTGYDVTNGGNPLYLGDKGRHAITTLYQPMTMATSPELDDLEDMRLVRQSLPGVFLAGELALTPAAVASLVIAFQGNNSGFLAVVNAKRVAEATKRLAAQREARFIAEQLQSYIDEGMTYAQAQAKQAANLSAKAAISFADDAAKIGVSAGDDAVGLAMRQVLKNAAAKLSQKLTQSVTLKFLGSVAGPVLTGVSFFASVFGEKLADFVKTADYEAGLLRDISTMEPLDVDSLLGANPTDAQKAPVLVLLVKMVIAEPADRHGLSLQFPEIDCPMGYVATSGICHRDVRFHTAAGLSLAQANEIAARNGWVVASSAEVEEAWQAKALDTFAYGMMSDGRFAVPIQSPTGSFGAGLNMGAEGGNQGFFYYQDFVDQSLGAGGSYIQNSGVAGTFLVFENTIRVNAASSKPGNRFASWNFRNVGGNYQIFNTALGDTAVINDNRGSLSVTSVHATGTNLWKITKADGSFYRIQSVAFPHRYLVLRDGKLNLDYIRSNEKGAIWHIPGGL